MIGHASRSLCALASLGAMMPTDEIRYYLPDCTLVTASYMSNDEWRLDTENDMPLFCTSKGVLHRLEYHEADNSYRLVPTDLTFDNLLLVD